MAAQPRNEGPSRAVLTQQRQRSDRDSQRRTAAAPQLCTGDHGEPPELGVDSIYFDNIITADKPEEIALAPPVAGTSDGGTSVDDTAPADAAANDAPTMPSGSGGAAMATGGSSGSSGTSTAGTGGSAGSAGVELDDRGSSC